MNIQPEIARRRTFAIISHPDAGKTTMTEKLLLYGGAIQQAGSVTAKQNQKQTQSDWMSIEQQRGISISSSAMSFEYGAYHINLLDTPGHQDFSEDTYRTLVAVDSALMMLDAARGVQAQTEKLFAVCRNKGVPIITFMNKLDRPAMDFFELLEQLEGTLNIKACPFTWPIGSGPDFKGVYDLRRGQVMLFERTEHGKHKAAMQVKSLDDPELALILDSESLSLLKEQVEFVQTVLEPFDPSLFLAGEQTPVFWGSAITNFGVGTFLDALVELAPAPGSIATTLGELQPTEPFTGFVFKLQANMSKQHRDRTAYMRVASGVFERGMAVTHTRTGRELRLSRAHTLFAQDRESIEVAYPGDIVGLVNPGVFQIGDVVSLNSKIRLLDFPRFTPEHFASVTPKDVSKRKAFRKGLEQLAEEGVVQIFYPTDGAKDPILGVVGQLQFEVFEHRMQEEYGVEIDIHHSSYKLVRWLAGEPSSLAKFAKHLADDKDRPVMLFRNSFDLDFALDQYPDLEFLPQPKDMTIIA